MQNRKSGVFKSVLMAYFILILHVVLIAILGVVVLFLGGLAGYMPWILLITAAALLGSGYYFYRRFKTAGKAMGDMLNQGPFRGRSVEISMFGGLASLKLGQGDPGAHLEDGRFGERRQLEDPSAVEIRELNKLVQMLEDGHITQDEFVNLKQQLFRS